LAIGRDDAELAGFGPGGLLDQIRGVMLQGSFQGAAYGVMSARSSSAGNDSCSNPVRHSRRVECQ
jgi:hypothetical protein